MEFKLCPPSLSKSSFAHSNSSIGTQKKIFLGPASPRCSNENESGVITTTKRLNHLSPLNNSNPDEIIILKNVTSYAVGAVAPGPSRYIGGRLNALAFPCNTKIYDVKLSCLFLAYLH